MVGLTESYIFFLSYFWRNGAKIANFVNSFVYIFSYIASIHAEKNQQKHKKERQFPHTFLVFSNLQTLKVPKLSYTTISTEKQDLFPEQ